VAWRVRPGGRVSAVEGAVGAITEVGAISAAGAINTPGAINDYSETLE